jgi:hypothetical protein
MMTGHQISSPGTDRSCFADLIVNDPELLDTAFASIVDFNWGPASPSRPRPGPPQRPEPHGPAPLLASPRWWPAQHVPGNDLQPRLRAPPTRSSSA